MKNKDKIKVCFKCKKLYDKCYCAYPWAKEISLYDIDKMLNNGKIL